MEYEHSLSFISKVLRRDGRLKLVFTEEEKLLLQDALDFWKMRDGYVQFTISRPVKPRTVGITSRRKIINDYCQQIAVATGQSFDDVKLDMKHRAISMGYPILYNKKGIPILDKYRRDQGIHEDDADFVETGYLLDTIKQFADGYEIKLKED